MLRAAGPMTPARNRGEIAPFLRSDGTLHHSVSAPWSISLAADTGAGRHGTRRADHANPTLQPARSENSCCPRLRILARCVAHSGGAHASSVGHASFGSQCSSSSGRLDGQRSRSVSPAHRSPAHRSRACEGRGGLSDPGLHWHRFMTECGHLLRGRVQPACRACAGSRHGVSMIHGASDVVWPGRNPSRKLPRQLRETARWSI